MVSFKEIYNTFFQYVDIVKLPRKLPRIFKSWLCACCVFQPAFGCCAQPKAGRTTFFSRFQPFLFMSNLFQWFHGWNQQKTSGKEQKMVFVNCYKLVDLQKLVDSLRGYLEIVFFKRFLSVFDWFRSFLLVYNFFEWKLIFSYFIFNLQKGKLRHKLT